MVMIDTRTWRWIRTEKQCTANVTPFNMALYKHYHKRKFHGEIRDLGDLRLAARDDARSTQSFDDLNTCRAYAARPGMHEDYITSLHVPYETEELVCR